MNLNYPAYRGRLEALDADFDPDVPDTIELEHWLRRIRNVKLTKADRQDAVNQAAPELAAILMDEQNTSDYLTLLALIIEHNCDGAAVMEVLRGVCVYVWPKGSTRAIGAVFRAHLRKRWGFKKGERRKKTRQPD